MTEAAKIGTIEVTEIMKMIPHRYPFLMIDRVIAIEPGESATGVKNVTMNEPHFMGHFPGMPVMPGVLIIEAMAQTAAIVVVKSMEQETSDKLVYFMSIEEAKFRKPVVPGDCMHIEVKKIQARRNVWKFSGEAKVDGNLYAEAIFTAMIMNKDGSAT